MKGILPTKKVQLAWTGNSILLSCTALNVNNILKELSYNCTCHFVSFPFGWLNDRKCDSWYRNTAHTIIGSWHQVFMWHVLSSFQANGPQTDLLFPLNTRDLLFPLSRYRNAPHTSPFLHVTCPFKLLGKWTTSRCQPSYFSFPTHVNCGPFSIARLWAEFPWIPSIKLISNLVNCVVRNDNAAEYGWKKGISPKVLPWKTTRQGERWR